MRIGHSSHALVLVVMDHARGVSLALACTWRRQMAKGYAGCSTERLEATPRRPTSVRTMIRCIGSTNGRPICGSSMCRKSRRCRACRYHIPSSKRLIGTVRRECLDRVLFWTAADLEMKLLEFQRYYNGHRTHAGLEGCTPEPSAGSACPCLCEYDGSRTVVDCIKRRERREACACRRGADRIWLC